MSSFFFFFFNDTATTEIYTLSLHDALPICELLGPAQGQVLRRDDLTLLVAEREHETITLLWPGRPRLVGPGEGAVGDRQTQPQPDGRRQECATPLGTIPRLPGAPSGGIAA